MTWDRAVPNPDRSHPDASHDPVRRPPLYIDTARPENGRIAFKRRPAASVGLERSPH
jgi:hypothetical protein